MKTLLFLMLFKCLYFKLSQTFEDSLFAFEGSKEYDFVYLPPIKIVEAFGADSDDNEPINYSFSAFGDSIDLNLVRNEKLASKSLKTFMHDGKGTELQENNHESNCHFLHKDRYNVGAISFCSPQMFNGLLLFNGKILEIYPMPESYRAKRSTSWPGNATSNDGTLHVVKKSTLDKNDYLLENRTFFHNALFAEKLAKDSRHRPVDAYTLELGLFFDAAAYKVFAPYLNYDDGKLQDMILAYINGVQALYHHPSLGTTIQLVLVRLDIHKTQPPNFQHFDGERGRLLDSFCLYQDQLNPPDDNDYDHWDMGLYISGLDFFAYENGRRSGVTMGLATVGGVCLPKYACVIAELGTTNVFGKPYPSAGFTSVYILAHEIGHNLGMHHDSSGNPCPKEGYIMSPSRGTNGETLWSTCSADVMSKLSWATCLLDGDDNPSKLNMDHGKFSDAPGQMFGAKRQCEILLTDKDAVVLPTQKLSTICYNLQCKTPHRSGYYHAGPALEGTECGRGMYCFGGECVPRKVPKPTLTVPGGWSAWKTGPCKSGCIVDSHGYQEKVRECNNPLPVNTDDGCEGMSKENALCSDEKLCYKKGRKSVVQFASEECRQFATLLPKLDPIGFGLQAPHEENRLWVGCAIFCRQRNSAGYYTPRVELNDMGVSPYFPDGTWCHSDDGGNYFCQQHHCLPEHFQFTKTFFNNLDGDLPFAQNAQPGIEKVLNDLKNYLSLDEQGKPLQTSLQSEITANLENEWETNDYVELPESLKI